MSIMVEGGLFPFTGKPFEVEYIPKETFEETIANESTSSWARFGAQCFLDILNANQLGYAGANLNATFPELQPVEVEEFLKKWWGKSE